MNPIDSIFCVTTKSNERSAQILGAAKNHMSFPAELPAMRFYTFGESCADCKEISHTFCFCLSFLVVESNFTSRFHDASVVRASSSVW